MGNISSGSILYIYTDTHTHTNFETVSFVSACEFIMHRVPCNQIYIQFPALLVFPVSITIILSSPLDFYGIFLPQILKGFTNINSHNILVSYKNTINPILQMRKQARKVNNMCTTFYLYDALVRGSLSTLDPLGCWYRKTELIQTSRLTHGRCIAYMQFEKLSSQYRLIM